MSSPAPQSLLERVFVPGPTRESPPLAPTGRAGRNLPAAIGTAVVLIAVVVVTLLFSHISFVVFVAVLAAAGLWELGGAFARVGINLTMPPLYMGALGILICAWFLGVEAAMVATYLTAFAVISWRLVDPQLKSRTQDVVLSVFSVMYVPFLASFVVLMLREFHSAWIVAVFVAVIAMNDIGGWFTGVLFGRHPMAPRLSPKKSWEGFAGSVTACAATGVGAFYFLGAAWWWGIIAGITAAIVGTLGDLLESLIKREVGLKDTSGLLPGHGGVLDRIDALLMFAPIFHFIVRLALAS